MYVPYYMYSRTAVEFIPPLIVIKKNLKENSAREYNIMPVQRKERICRQAASGRVGRELNKAM